jgi:cob(I)alamin adenosyltransferase
MPFMPPKEGLLIINTGPGKGKTTAALGAALRALGHGWRICLLQFLKSPDRESGERQAAAAFGGRLEMHALGEGFVFNSKNDIRHREAARAAWDLAAAKISSGAYGLVILDEISYPLAFGFLETGTLLEALRRRPAHVHVVLTGRDMPAAVIQAADLVTVMAEEKHPFHQGRKYIEGIDY